MCSTVFIWPKRPGTLEPERPHDDSHLLTLNVLGDLRTRPTEVSAGSLTVDTRDPMFDEGVSNDAIHLWLHIHAIREWKLIHDWMLEADGQTLRGWEDHESGAFWLAAMGWAP